MTETFQQIPGALDIEVGLGDDFSFLLDFDISLVGYTFAAYVDMTTISVANTDLAAGKITLSLTDAQITTIGTGPHTWYLIWTTGTTSRRILAGNFTILEFPA
jgi:hypothetical protein